jgi:hypothetical protein
MLEKVTLPPVEATQPLPEEQAEQRHQFEAVLEAQCAVLPEVKANQESIARRGAELINEFGLLPEFFADSARVLFFTAIANRYSKLEDQKSGMGVGEYTKEKEFIADATVLLAQSKSTHFAEHKGLIDANDTVDPAREAKIYDKYTNVQVSQELKQAIDNGLLDEVKQRLGITTENEDAFDIKVLNIANDNGMITYGMYPTMPDDLNDKVWNDPAWVDHNNTVSVFKAYEKGLKDNYSNFYADLDRTGSLPTAWVSSNISKTTLCMPLPFAEKILYKDQPRSKYYTEADQQRDFAALEHEYTHTQGGLNLDKNVFFGIAFEERRAELFSKDKLGYMDIKGSINDASMITGMKFVGIMKDVVKGGTAEQFYQTIAAEIGLDSMLELALAPPSAYVDSPRRLQAEIAEYLGGVDGVSQRLAERAAQSGKKNILVENIDSWAAELAKMDKEKADGFLAYRRGGIKLEYVTDLLAQRVDEIRQKQTAH